MMEKRITLKRTIFVLLWVAAILGLWYSFNQPRSAYVTKMDPGLLNGCYVGPSSKATIRAGTTLALNSGEVARILEFSEDNNHYSLSLSWDLKDKSKFEDFGIVYWEQRPNQVIGLPKRVGESVILTKAAC
jgi:hypothetical protein